MALKGSIDTTSSSTLALLVSPRRSERCELCGQPITVRLRTDGKSARFQADPDVVRGPYLERQSHRAIEEVAVAELHDLHCAETSRSLFDVFEDPR